MRWCASTTLDANGVAIEAATPQTWNRVQVSAVLRALDALERDRGGLMRLPGRTPLVLLNPLLNPKAEASFLQAVQEVFWEARQLGCPGGGKASNAINYLTAALMRHFIATRRFSRAETFFSKFRPNDPTVAVLITRAALHDKHANFTRVLGLLAASIVREGQSSKAAQLLLIQQSKILCNQSQFEAAVAVARASLMATGPYHFDVSRSGPGARPPFPNSRALVSACCLLPATLCLSRLDRKSVV